jgi:DNA (cytosine-5)-methyltransferase 1
MIIVDNFAGGGGASTGIELAIGRPVDIAINHDPAAVAMHKVNHPNTLHYCESVWDVDPRKIAQGKLVVLNWLSPDCKHHSKARGGKPRDKNIRGLAWIGVRWGATVKPLVQILENVEEFQDWGPLTKDNKPDPKQKGRTFRVFVNALKYQGYRVEWRKLRACDYGAPTTRERLVMISRCDGKPIVWPKATHGDPNSEAVKSGKLKPWRTAAEIIDWSLPTPSIFETATEIRNKYNVKAVRPLATRTMIRIAKGMDKFFIKNPDPFIIQVNHGGNNFRGQSLNKPMPTLTSKHGYGLVAPMLLQYHDDQKARGQSLDKPILTIDSSPRYALVSASLIKYYGQGVGQKVTEPLHTVTSKDHSAFCVYQIIKFKGDNKGQVPNGPLQTITASIGQFGLVSTFLRKINGTQELGYWSEIRVLLNKYCDYNIGDDEVLIFEINGDQYFIGDIGLRMLIPRELFDAQGFPPDYVIDKDYYGKAYSKAAQVARCGNAVPPPLAENLVRSNLPELCGVKEPVKEERQMSLF